MNCVCPLEQKEKGSLLHKIAKVIRGVTVPPVMVASLLIVLWFGTNVFSSVWEFTWMLLLLAVVPVLAYIAQKLLPGFREGGQKAQRKLAFVFSFLGYGAAVVVCALCDAVPNQLYIAVVYLVSVVILTAINCLTPWHASGHACSLMGPLVLASLFVGWYAIPISLVVYVASFWASIYMKRHTVREFLLGSLSSTLSAVLCYFFIHPIF